MKNNHKYIVVIRGELNSGGTTSAWYYTNSRKLQVVRIFKIFEDVDRIFSVTIMSTAKKNDGLSVYFKHYNARFKRTAWMK